jgi:hypothetical protein
MPWESALEQVLRSSYEGLERDRIGWAIIGSVASVLQGCRVSPRDLDILTVKPEHVNRFTELMSAYAPPHCEYPPDDEENWHSSEEHPVRSGLDEYGFMWHFARWYVDSFTVEVAHILAPQGFPTSDDDAGIWEAGPEIWPHVRKIPFAGYPVPVVPLEIQLETNMARGLQDRVQEIITILQDRGYDRALLKRSLSSGHREAVQELMQS